MAEPEVESILREIRERVLSQQRSGHNAVPSVRTTTGNHANGASESGPTGQMTRRGAPQAVVAESLALIDSYLTTTARAWDRLPPLVSNRSGAAARFELWVKQHLKRATRWYAWEQVNFNAAVHHALRDMLQVLATYERELGTLHAQADVANEQRRIEFERNQIEFERNQTEFATLRAEIAAQRAKIQAETGLANTHKGQVEARLTELLKELRERDEHLRDEQRVCFKQLALETSEAAMLEARARQTSKALLEELTRRIEQLEK